MFLNGLGLAEFSTQVSGNLSSPEVLTRRRMVILSLEYLYPVVAFSSHEVSVSDGKILTYSSLSSQL